MTIYARSRRQSALASLSFLVFAVVADSHGAHGLAIFLLVLTVVLTAYVARRPRLSADENGVTIVNLLRVVRVPWSEISGFGRTRSGMGSCLTVRKRDGKALKAWVVTDAARGGYSSQRVQEITADLRERLTAAVGTVDGGDVGGIPTVAQRSRGRRVVDGIPAVTGVLTCLFFVVFGVAIAWHATTGLPQTYSRLRAYGIPLTASFAGCSVIDLRTNVCRLTLDYRGTSRTWDYAEDYGQFGHIAIGAPVPVLVDPAHPTVVYTVRDVDHNYGAGFGVLAILGVVFAIVGLVGLLWSYRLRRRSAARRRELLTRFSPDAFP